MYDSGKSSVEVGSGLVSATRIVPAPAVVLSRAAQATDEARSASIHLTTEQDLGGLSMSLALDISYDLDDSGLVSILDNRILTKRYGKLFLQALPDAPVEIVE